MNPIKYNGDPTNITYRSGLERTVMRYFDLHNDVISWSSEEVIVPYRSPIDNRVHRYFVDFWCSTKTADGTINQLLIEVKPLGQCKEPVKKARKTQRYLRDVQAWGVNLAKWKAARSYADARGWRFVIMTEKQINGLEY